MTRSIQCLLTLSALCAFSVCASAQSSSTSYAIALDVVDSGGATAMSASYTLSDSVGQPAALGQSASASYRLQPGFLSPPDTDADTVRDFMDNCSQDANPDQRDSNADGFGNLCDPDLNNDGITNALDLGLTRLNFFTANPDADLNGDGVVNFIDLGIVRLRFFTAPGPSGIAP